MAKRKNNQDGHDAETVRIVVETPKNSRNKYAFDKKSGAFLLKKVLPAGMAFPYDFGFVPDTRADDGDPIDVLLLMDEPAFPGCVLDARLIGAIEGEDVADGRRERNDRLLAVAAASHTHADLRHIDDLSPRLLAELEHFFEAYNALDEKKFNVLGVVGPGKARKLLRASAQNAR